MRKVLIYLLFILGGVAALTLEVMWMRGFRVVFGSSVQSASAVLAAFFGGMALGSLIGARLAHRSRPLRLYGWIALWIGLTALLVGPWLELFRQGYPTLYPWFSGRPSLAVLVKLLLAIVALGPPAVGMGATLPVVIRAIVPGTQRLARATSLLYAVNVFGATLGAALAGFVLPMWLGVAGAVYAAAAINIAIGIVALCMSGTGAESAERMLAQPAVDQPAPSAPRARGQVGVIALIAAASGFGTLALEVLYVRILSFRTEGSVYSFSLMLVIFLLCLAMGSLVVARWGDRSNLWRALAKTQLAAVVAILLTPVLFEIALATTLVVGADSLIGRMASLGLISIPTLGLPVILAGIVLPGTWKLASGDAAAMGSRVGRLVAYNTIAGVAGSLATGFVLLPWLGLGGSLLAVAALYSVIAMTGFWYGYAGMARWIGCALCVSIPAIWLASGLWQTGVPLLAESETLLRTRDGAGASVAVVEHPGGHRSLRMNHAYTLGSSSDAARELRQGRLPLVLHPRPKRVAFVGMATGITASAALDFPIERAVLIELVPEVSDALGDFQKWNRAVHEDPRMELVVDDGRNYLLGTSERFDVIVSDLFLPWHAGTGDLYTVEHFRTVAGRLAEGGLFAQWLPGYQLTVEEVRTIVASMLEAFPAVALWRNDFERARPLLCLVGYKDGPRVRADALAESSRRLSEGRGPAASFLSTPLGIAMLYVAGSADLAAWAKGAPLNTDNVPIIEYTTPGSFYRHQQRNVAGMNEFLAGFRPRTWQYSEPAIDGIPMSTALHAADLMHDAQLAGQNNRFDLEFKLLSELIPVASDVPAVAAHVIGVANRYRSRNMVNRSDALLGRLIEQPTPPLVALVTLANIRQQDGKLPEAIDLLARAVQRAPDVLAIRSGLVELLKQTQQHTLIEEHLQYILEHGGDDPYLRLDLASALDHQDKTEDAREQVEHFRRLRLRDDQRRAWQYLRSLGLGKYIDNDPAGAPGATPQDSGSDANTAVAPD